MSAASSLILLDVDPRGIATVTLNSPETRNALSDALLDEMLAVLLDLGARDDVRVVAITSSHDRIFSAGGDLKAFASDVPVVTKYLGLDRFPTLFRTVTKLPKPVVCVANGDVLAGAFGLALACDLVVAKDGIKLGCPEINVGVFPFMISALIHRTVDRLKANELMMLGDLIDAREAERLNLVNKVFAADSFDADVDAWLGRLAAKSPLLMRLGKEALARTGDMTLDQALDSLQAQLALAFTTHDIQEGVAAFRERRDPQWTGS